MLRIQDNKVSQSKPLRSYIEEGNGRGATFLYNGDLFIVTLPWEEGVMAFNVSKLSVSDVFYGSSDGALTTMIEPVDVDICVTRQ